LRQSCGTEARQSLTRAADSGDVESLLMLAACYEDGVGGAGDAKEAVACYERAVKLGSAAASVLAKVSRDHYVVEVLDPMYPEYQFARHKGYGTKLHYQMLDQYGPSPVHRMTFLKKWEARR